MALVLRLQVFEKLLHVFLMLIEKLLQVFLVFVLKKSSRLLMLRLHSRDLASKVIVPALQLPVLVKYFLRVAVVQISNILFVLV